jgi:hypothetical protein
VVERSTGDSAIRSDLHDRTIHGTSASDSSLMGTCEDSSELLTILHSTGGSSYICIFEEIDEASVERSSRRCYSSYSDSRIGGSHDP